MRRDGVCTLECEGRVYMTDIAEMDYYDHIVEFYDRVECEGISQRDIDIWEGKTYISLMKDIKENKKFSDSNVEDSAINAIILVLNLFRKKKNTDLKVKNLPENCKIEIHELLKCCI